MDEDLHLSNWDKLYHGPGTRVKKIFHSPNNLLTPSTSLRACPEKNEGAGPAPLLPEAGKSLRVRKPELSPSPPPSPARGEGNRFAVSLAREEGNRYAVHLPFYPVEGCGPTAPPNLPPAYTLPGQALTKGRGLSPPSPCPSPARGEGNRFVVSPTRGEGNLRGARSLSAPDVHRGGGQAPALQNFHF